MNTVAIDFGTSNTIVATLDPLTQTPRTIRFNNISRRFKENEVYTVPTLVFVEDSGNLIFGEEVRTKRLGLDKANKEKRFQSFKRLLVADYQPPARKIGENIYDAKSISESFIAKLWEELAKQNIRPTKVIFTVPVGSFERYLDWFREVAKKLNINQVQLVDESTAAALGYTIQKIGSLVLVIDLGGGTLDLSLVRTESTNQYGVMQAQVIAKSDAYIGGVDIDSWIVEHYLAKNQFTRDSIGETGWNNLLELAEVLKIRLSQNEQAADSWFDDENFVAHELVLERTELAEILENRQLLSQIRESLDDVLSNALNKGIQKADIEKVLLVGGSCQIPAIKQLVVSYFGPNRVKLDKPFEAVAHGALALDQLVEVEDYLRHGYAIRVWDPNNRAYVHYPLFKAGAQYPISSSSSMVFQSARDGQSKIILDIGEIAESSKTEMIYDASGQMTTTQLVKEIDFRSLEIQKNANVCLANLEPPGKIGEDRISVDFAVNKDRFLTATVVDIVTGKILADREPIGKLK